MELLGYVKAAAVGAEALHAPTPLWLDWYMPSGVLLKEYMHGGMPGKPRSLVPRNRWGSGLVFALSRNAEHYRGIRIARCAVMRDTRLA